MVSFSSFFFDVVLSCYKKYCIVTVTVFLENTAVKKKILVLGIRIRRFLGFPDPDPLVRGLDPDPVSSPDPSNFASIMLAK